jgi:hypothetical protein
MNSSRPSQSARIKDGGALLASWGKQIAALAWTPQDLFGFGLADVPDKPRPNYQWLSRNDLIGLVWLSRGRRVALLTKETAEVTIFLDPRAHFGRPA